MTTASLPLHIDSTMMVAFRGCPQKFYREFAQGYRPTGLSIDLHAGACFALALEITYKGIWKDKLHLSEALVRSHAAFAQAWGNFEIPEWKKTNKTFDRVWAAVESYFTYYPPLSDHIQPYLATDGSPTFEYTFAIPLEPACNWGTGTAVDDGYFPLHPNGSPFLYTGRFDQLGSIAGRPVIKDDKTTGGSFSQRWSETFNLRNQFLGYVWACRQCGIDVDSVLVRGIAIQKTDIKHEEALKPYSAFMLDRWHEQLRRDLWRIRRAWDEGFWDFNLGDTCTAYGNCVFMDVCQSPNDESWLSNFEVRRWDPLEKNPAKVEDPAKVSAF